jgi:hypothetical protein
MKKEYKIEEEQLLKSSQVCEWLNISQCTLTALRPQLKVTKVGKGYRYFKKDILSFLEKQREGQLNG